MSRAADGKRPSRRDLIFGLLLAESEPLSIAEISRREDLHPNTVRFHLNALTAAGRVRRARSSARTPGRPALLFQAVRGVDPEGPRGYRLLADILISTMQDSPDPTSAAVRSGRAWGRRQTRAAAVEIGSTPESPSHLAEPLVRLMDELGFAPELVEDGEPSADGATGGAVRIQLRHCPFLELSETAADVVCPLHLGLMEGALQAWDSPLVAASLEPFVEPDRCVAHLAMAAPGGQ